MKHLVKLWIVVPVALLLTPFIALGGNVASVRVKATFVSEPTWHDYGSSWVDAQGRVNKISMPMPFFHVVSIDTEVYVELDHINVVVDRMQARRVNGNSDLMVAATAGDTNAVKALLAKNVMVNTKNTFGSTALMGAAAGGHVEVAKLLLAKGARVNENNNQGYTALMLAAKNGHDKVVDLLLGGRAEVNAADSKNNTALMYAVHGGNADVAKTLIDKGARVNYKSSSGVSPLALATKKENKELVALLTRSLTMATTGRS